MAPTTGVRDAPAAGRRARVLEGFCARRTKKSVSHVCRAKMVFTVKKKVRYGEKLCLVGDHKKFGRWDIQRGYKLRWNEGHVWTADVDIDAPEVEFKVVRLRAEDREPEWESGNNRRVAITDSSMKVELKWDSTDNGGTVITSGGPAAAGTSDSTPPPAASQPTVAAPEAPKAEPGRRDIPAGEVGSPEMDAAAAWQGKEIQFMTENRHSKERRGVWNTAGLAGTELELVQGDERSGSWLQKLEVVKAQLVDRAADMRPSLDALAPVFVYMQWVATGAIECVEGGGHYRPNKHAELSQIMFRSLEWVIGDAGADQMRRYVARKLQAKLPSFSESFTASTPLTRIRDIAHRNDIPHDLKREIKHTIQNKLHRNAGPEDLVATQAMLRRITAPGTDYSGAFVHEFKVFADELADFFSAGSLTKLLAALEGSLEEAGVGMVAAFLRTKGEVDRKGGDAGAEELVACLHELTSVRSLLVAGLASGLRNDAPDSALISRQRWRLAELRCEEYAFVLLSRILNALEGTGGAGVLVGAGEAVWAHPLMAQVLALRHCGLSGWQAAECAALDDELGAWQKGGVTTGRESLLRLKASLERVKRLTDTFTSEQLTAFVQPAKQLGTALGLSNELYGIFAESEIRASVVFQLSKVNEVLLKAVRLALGSSDYDALVLGSATGVLVAVDTIQPGMDLAAGSDCILLVDSASGDEEVSTAGSNIKGVVLCQDLPHLSHLGVRARQERVPFATCTNDEVVDGCLRPLLGQRVRLAVAADAVTVAKAAAQKPAAAPPATVSTAPSSANGAVPDAEVAEVEVTAVGSAAGRPAKPAHITVAEDPEVIPLREAEPATSGGKAAACARLATLAQRSRGTAAFSAPGGAVLPFGGLVAAVKTISAYAPFSQLLEDMDDAAVGEALDAACAEMQELVREARPDAKTVKALQEALAGVDFVVVRSSANVEDLEGLSGAGLYESVPNVRVTDDEALGAAVAEVWASLYSRRAVLSRRSAGIRQSEAAMAVLVQEMVAPEISFVLHTADPLTGADGRNNANSVYAELAPGLGEILAAGTEGSAWRMSINKTSGATTLHAFANFSQAWLPRSSGSQRGAPGDSIYSSVDGGAPGGLTALKAVDYSKHPLSTKEEARQEVGGRLAKIGAVLEAEFGSAQDVEGGIVGDDVFIVQSRPQP